MRQVQIIAAVAFAALAAGGATAHPKLVSATPAAGTAVAAPAQMTLRFNEKLVASFTGADLMLTGMPGMKHPPAKLASAAAVGADGKSLVVTPAKPLAAGSYRLDWHAVAADTHRVKGSLAFQVK